jgi:ADP-heptose:LPS heptosyltransferase
LDTGDHPRFENLLLPEVVRLVRHSRGFIGNDSGITHLAAYFGCPTIALFGPTDPAIWGPVGKRVRILFNRTLKDIRVDEVLTALQTTNNFP